MNYLDIFCIQAIPQPPLLLVTLGGQRRTLSWVLPTPRPVWSQVIKHAPGLDCSEGPMSQFPASQASCMTVTAESVSSVLMAATSLSGVSYRNTYYIQRKDLTQISAGQTSCWPCPANTTTDGPGASSLDMCKSHACPFYAKVTRLTNDQCW